ncbi:MAG: class I SAM-dependent methyltransferase [Streptosporangiaceae bacterium]
MSADERWLAAGWTFVRGELPPPPATVLEVGCGSLGGFVPRLIENGYDASGVDPEAPAGDRYRQVEFERHDLQRRVDAVVASTSFHHVADLDLVLGKVVSALRPGGTVVVIEWASERFDEATAQWCFARLVPPEPGEEPGWLHKQQGGWAASGEPWHTYFAGWVNDEELHPGGKILSGLDARFAGSSCTYGPYFFSDLAGTTEADEQAAIDDGQIQATGIRYVARLPRFAA